MADKVIGAEGIIIHDNKIVLGMQKRKRWYTLKNGEQAGIVKTLGGAVEKQDNNSTRNALIRELLEEIRGINIKDINIDEFPIFSKNIKMKDLNPYELDSELEMEADFYIVKIDKKCKLVPNDLPMLMEIPIEKFLNTNLSESMSIKNMEEYMLNKNIKTRLPSNYAIMAPIEVKSFLRSRGDEER